MFKKQPLFKALFFGYICLLLVSCGNDKGSTDTASGNDSLSAPAPVSKAKQVFYSIPSPLQMAALLKNSGAKYNHTILNSTESISKYVSSSDMALNLGIYGTDMSFASIFNQAQETMMYLKCVNTLSRSLAISNAFDQTTANRIEANVDNKDSLLLIIAEAYWEADAHLKEDNRPGLSAMIIVGGWIEGLHLAVNVAKETNSEAVKKRIAEQKLSLNNLINLLYSYPEDDEIKRVIGFLNELKGVFESITISSENVIAKTDVSIKTTTITGDGTISAVTDEQLVEISKKLEYIRNEIIK